MNRFYTSKVLSLLFYSINSYKNLFINAFIFFFFFFFFDLFNFHLPLFLFGSSSPIFFATIFLISTKLSDGPSFTIDIMDVS